MSWCFDTSKALWTGVSAATLIGGALLADGAFDESKAPTSFESCAGGALFVIGWCGVATSSFVQPGSGAFSLTANPAAVWQFVAALAVLGTVLLANRVATSAETTGYSALLIALFALVAIAWVLYAVATSLSNGGVFDRRKLIMTLMGAASIGAGLLLMFQHRKRLVGDAPAPHTTGPGLVYSAGLPLYTGGWALVTIANALI